MFIPVSMKPLSQKPSEFVADNHISLEQVKGFFTRLKQTSRDDGYIVEADDQEYFVTEETYKLLKSLVLRP